MCIRDSLYWDYRYTMGLLLTSFEFDWTVSIFVFSSTWQIAFSGVFISSAVVLCKRHSTLCGGCLFRFSVVRSGLWCLVVVTITYIIIFSLLIWNFSYYYSYYIIIISYYNMKFYRRKFLKNLNESVCTLAHYFFISFCFCLLYTSRCV